MADQRRRVVWTDEAHTALDDAISFIVQESPQRARLLIERSLEAAASLGRRCQSEVESYQNKTIPRYVKCLWAGIDCSTK